MALLPRSMSPQTIITLLLVVLCFMNMMSVSISKAASNTTSDHDTNKVEKTLMEADEYHSGIKCGSCPCVNPCAQQQLPPPPPPPPPPPSPPENCNPTLPSPPENCNPTLPSPPENCNPTSPPPPRFIYVTGIPGEMYQSRDQNAWKYYYSGAGPNVVQGSRTLLLVVGGLVLQLLLIMAFRS